MRYPKFFLLTLIVLMSSLNISCSDSTSANGTGSGVDKVFYSINQGDGLGVYTMNINGSGKTYIHDGIISSLSRGKTILILKTFRNDSTEFITTDLYGQAEVKLFSTNGLVQVAVLSPDKKSVLYERQKNGTPFVVVIHNIENSTETIISDTINNTLGVNTPVFSPDSKKVLIPYYSLKDNVGKIGIVSADGFGQIDSIMNAFVYSYAFNADIMPFYDFSPDGESVIYYSLTYPSSINVYDLASRNSNTIVSDSLFKIPLSFSPKGNYFVYQTYTLRKRPHPNQTAWIGTLWVYDFKIGQTVRYPIPFLNTFGAVLNCQWSPDEQKILMQTSEEDSSGINKFRSLIFDRTKGAFSDLNVVVPSIFFWGSSINL